MASSTCAATAALARPGPISAAISPGVMSFVVLLNGSVGEMYLQHAIH